MTKNNIQELLRLLEFEHDGNVYFKRYENANEPLKVDISGDGHIYYRECGISIGRATTCNLLEPENLVVLYCVDRLLWKGYSPFHIELEPAWKLGHSTKGGYADVWVRPFKNEGFDGSGDDKESLLIIECKAWGREFEGAWADTKEDGAQLFSYFQQERVTKFLCLYTADIVDGKLEHNYHLINVHDNEDKLTNEESAKSYKNAANNKQLYNVWHETYNEDYAMRRLFENEIELYRIGKNKYTTKDLKSVDNDTIQKKYNEFALILRQHNAGGYENAFDKLGNLFLAKVVDETVVNPRYLLYPLLKAGETERFSRCNRASTERVKTLSIMLPDIETQNEVAQQLINMKSEIISLKSKMQDCIAKKQEIVDKYLK